MRAADSEHVHAVGKQRPLGTKMPKRAPKLKKGFLPRTGAGIEIETVNPKVKDRKNKTEKAQKPIREKWTKVKSQSQIRQ